MTVRIDKPKNFWYMTVFEMCPVCGEERSYKYRIYGCKPNKREERIEYRYINHYCYI